MVFAAGTASNQALGAVAAVLAIAVLIGSGVGFRLWSFVGLLKTANDEYREEIAELRRGRSDDRKECDEQLHELRGEVTTLRALVTSDIAKQVATQVAKELKL